MTSSPQARVYLDDQFIGETPLCRCEADEMVESGDYTIRLEPIGSGLAQFQEKINVSKGVLTVVDRTFGKGSLSEGSVISLSPILEKEKTELLVVSFPEGSTALLDNSEIGKTPLLFENPTESDHILTIKKEGYSEKTIRVRTPKGYKLTVAVYLSTGEKGVNNVINESPSVASDIVTEKVIILQTPTGFLRVRSSGGLNSSEIGQVKPGEVLDLISEENGWYQIKLSDGSVGWVSSDYAEKE